MSADILSFNRVRPRRADPVLAQVEGYWEALRDGRPAPARAEVDPRGLADVLKHCFVLERIAAGFARCRVTGQAVNGLMGLEMKGMPISAMFLPETRDTLEDALERMFDGPRTLALTLRSPAGFKRKQITGQMLVFPLRSDLGEITRALGCIVTEGETGPAPRRFRIEACRLQEIPLGHRISSRHDEPAPPEGRGQVIALPRPDDRV